MLLRQHARRQRRRVVARQHRHRRLRQDRPRIHRLGDQMHGAAMQLHPGRQRPRMRVQAGEGRQQAGVDVQHPPGPARRRSRASAAACSRPGRPARRRAPAVPRRSPPHAPRGRRRTGDGRRTRVAHPARPRHVEARRARPRCDSASPISAGKSGAAGRVQQRAHIGAAPAEQDRRPGVTRASASRHGRCSARARLRRPRCGRSANAVSPCSRQQRRSPRRRRRRPAPCRCRS